MKSIKTSLLLTSLLLASGAAFAASNGPSEATTVNLDEDKWDVDNKVPEGLPSDVYHAISFSTHNRQVYRVPAKGYKLAVIEDGKKVSRVEVVGQRMAEVEAQNAKVSAPYKYKAPKRAD